VCPRCGNRERPHCIMQQGRFERPAIPAFFLREASRPSPDTGCPPGWFPVRGGVLNNPSRTILPVARATKGLYNPAGNWYKHHLMLIKQADVES
jgi:hypothetical protein